MGSDNKEIHKKKKSNPIWKIIFILLLLVNVIFFSWSANELSRYMGAMAGFAVFPLALPLVIIDLFAVFTYIIKQDPQGKAKFVSYSVFTIISLMLVYVGVALVNTFF